MIMLKCRHKHSPNSQYEQIERSASITHCNHIFSQHFARCEWLLFSLALCVSLLLQMYPHWMEERTHIVFLITASSKQSESMPIQHPIHRIAPQRITVELISHCVFLIAGKTIKKFKAPYGWLCAPDGSKPVNIFIVIKPQSVWRECKRETPKSFPSNKCRKLCVFSAHNRVATLHPHVWINKRKCFSFG